MVCQGRIDLNQEMNIGAGAQCRISAAQLPETAARLQGEIWSCGGLPAEAGRRPDSRRRKAALSSKRDMLRAKSPHNPKYPAEGGAFSSYYLALTDNPRPENQKKWCRLRCELSPPDAQHDFLCGLTAFLNLRISNGCLIIRLGSKAAADVRTPGCSAAHNAENTKPARACPLEPEQ